MGKESTLTLMFSHLWFLCVKDMFPDSVSLAREYLEDSVSSGAVSNYSLCLVAYALVLAKSPSANVALFELSQRADYKGNEGGPVSTFTLRHQKYFLLFYSQMYSQKSILISGKQKTVPHILLTDVMFSDLNTRVKK